MAEGEYDDVPLDPGFIPEGWPIESPSSSATNKTPRATAPLADAAPPPPAKQRRLSLSLRKGSAPGPTSTSRFAPPVSEVEYEEAAEGVVPANIWAVGCNYVNTRKLFYIFQTVLYFPNCSTFPPPNCSTFSHIFHLGGPTLKPRNVWSL